MKAFAIMGSGTAECGDCLRHYALVFELGLAGVDSRAPATEDPASTCRVRDRDLVESLGLTPEWISENSAQVVVNEALSMVHSLDVVSARKL